MAATTTEVRARYAELFVVLEELVMGLDEVNMKDWEATDVEIAQEAAAQVTFNASAAIANDTATKTGTESAVTATTMEAYMVEAKKLNAIYQPIVEGLREKRWNEVERLLPLRFGVRTDLAAAVTAFAGDAGTVGADLTNVQAVCGMIVNILNNVEAMMIFRREKQYSEVARVLAIILPEIVTAKAAAAAIIDRNT